MTTSINKTKENIDKEIIILVFISKSLKPNIVMQLLIIIVSKEIINSLLGFFKLLNVSLGILNWFTIITTFHIKMSWLYNEISRKTRIKDMNK